MKKGIIMGMTVLMALTFNACKKPKDGAPGIPGKAGINGTNGTNGTNGNANVLSSASITTNNWILVSNDGQNYVYTTTLSWAGITQEIIDKGVVMVYHNDSIGKWTALPYTYNSSLFSYSLNFGFSTGAVTLEFNAFINSGSITPGENTFRIIAIPSSRRMAHPEVNLKNYYEVKKTFNLKD